SLPLTLNLPSPTLILPLSLHDALPISALALCPHVVRSACHAHRRANPGCVHPRSAAAASARAHPAAWTQSPLPARTIQSPAAQTDRKSTRLNSSHEWISYAVFCLKKKK